MVKRYFISGVWDLLHAGHVNALKRARQIAGDDRLVVAVVTDAGAYLYKGRFPVQSYEQRRDAVEALGLADELVFDGAQFDIQYLRSLRIDGALFGRCWQADMPQHLQHLMQRLPVGFIAMTPGVSSTGIIRQMEKA